MRYKILKTVAGPDINLHEGTESEVPEKYVVALVKSGAIEAKAEVAVEIKEEVIEKAEAPVKKKEVAVASRRRRKKTLVSG